MIYYDKYIKMGLTNAQNATILPYSIQRKGGWRAGQERGYEGRSEEAAAPDRGPGARRGEDGGRRPRLPRDHPAAGRHPRGGAAGQPARRAVVRLPVFAGGPRRGKPAGDHRGPDRRAEQDDLNWS